MKASTPHGFFGVAVVLLVVSSVAAERDYMATDLDDPLQPVWSTLDRLPRNVSAAVISAMRPQLLSMLNTQLEEKLQPLLRSVSLVLHRLGDLMHNTDRGMSTGPSGNFAMFYDTRIMSDLTESVTKIERHIDTKVAELENKLKLHIDSRFSAVGNIGGEGGRRGNTTSSESVGDGTVAQTVMANALALENINTHVLKINEKLGGSSEGSGGDSCTTLVDKVSELMDGSVGQGGVCASANQETLLSLGLPRDCSDKHWHLPEAPSGVYETFPTLDPKAPVSSYCDMGQPGTKDTGGWTVILRRRNSSFGLVDFNRTWEEYRNGFGDPAEGEWWFGLANLHALTYRQPYEVHLLLHDIETGAYYTQYTGFRIEDEARNFRLILSGNSGNLTHDALIEKHHGAPFSTWDKDNDEWKGSCAEINGGGWWFVECHYTTLTAPFPTSNDRNARTIRWLEDDWLVLNDVIMKIRPANYAQRFSPPSEV